MRKYRYADHHKVSLLMLLLVGFSPLLLATDAPASSSYSDASDSLYTGSFKQALALLEELSPMEDERADWLRDLGLGSYFLGNEKLALDRFGKSMEQTRDGELQASEILSFLQIVPILSDPKYHDKIIQLAEDVWRDDRLPIRSRRAAKLAAMRSQYWRGLSQRLEGGARELGAVTDWLVIGPFENVAQSGWNKGFGVEEDFRALRKMSTVLDFKKYSGEDGIQAAWFEPSHYILGGYLPLEDYYTGYGQSVFYATTKLRIKSPRQAVVWLRTPGFFKLWLNGDLVAENPSPGSSAILQSVEINLAAGSNLFLLKLGGGGNSAGFELCLTDSNGAAISLDTQAWQIKLENSRATHGFGTLKGRGENSSNLYDLIDTRMAWGANLAPTFKDWISDLGLDPESGPEEWLADLTPREAFWKGISLLPHDETAFLYSRQCLVNWPNSESFRYLHYLASRANGQDERLLQIAETMYRQEPKSELFRYLYADHLTKQLLRRKAVQILNENDTPSRIQRSISNSNPPLYPIYAFLLYDNLTALEEEEQAAQLLKYMELAWPKSPPVMALKAQKSIEHFQRKEAAKLLEESLKSNPTNLFNTRLLLALSKDWDKGKYLKALGMARDTFPTAYWILDEELETLLSLDKSDGLLERMKEASRQFPLSERWLEMLSSYYKGAYHFYEPQLGSRPEVQGLKTDAINALTAILDRNPYRQDAEIQRLRLQGITPIWEILPEHTLERFARGAPSPESHPNQSGVILLKEARRIILSREASRFEFFLAGKIFTQSGAREMKTVPIRGVHPYFQKIEALEILTLKKSGEIKEGTLGPRSVQLKDLDVGDVFFIHISVQGTPYLEGAVQDEFYFQDVMPVEESRYMLICRDQLSVTLKTQGYSVEEKSEFASPYSIKSWTLRKLPAIQLDSYAPPGNRTVAQVEFSTLGGWEQVVDWYQRLSGNKAYADWRVLAKLKEICSPEDSLEEKIRSAFGFVCNEIRYEDLDFQSSAFIPEMATQVLSAGVGDCKDKASLLIAMLRELDVAAEFVLASPFALEGAFDPPGFHFDHVFVLAHPNDTDFLWLDPTASGNAFGHVAASYQGGTGLIISPKTVGTMTFPWQLDQELHRCEATLFINLNGSGILAASETFSGDLATAYRNLLQGLPDGEIERRLNHLLHMRFGNNTLLDFECGDLYGIDSHWNLKYRLALPICTVQTSETEAMLRLPDPLVLDFSIVVPDSPGGRRDALRLASTGTEVINMAVTFAEGLKPSFIPFPTRVIYPPLLWQREFEENDGVLMVSWRAKAGPELIDASEVDGFRKSTALIAAAENLSIALRKKR